jgi:amino acid transporter
MSLVAFLAWVGLGADGLSSSAYGPEEAFKALGTHTYLAVFLAIATAATVFIISWSYRRIIEEFPHGGGGYIVASKHLGPYVGAVSGCALIVDYVLTIAISLASGTDAVFSFLPAALHPYKLEVVLAVLGILTIMNLRGVKESVTVLTPLFLAFLVTHAILIFGAVGSHAREVGAVATDAVHELRPALLLVVLRAFSLGGGTFTGIEAVSNGLAIMREPRVRTAKRTMLLMAISLAVTAAGILLAYLLLDIHPVAGKTMNAVLAERLAGAGAFVVITLVSEGALLFVAAQAGFVDGPRVMANMALDQWMPHRMAALSEHLTMRNGVYLMAGAAALLLVYTGGSVSALVVMYSINVFITFTLSNVAMVRHARRGRALFVHLLAAIVCGTILVVTVIEKLEEGGWITLVITAALVGLCALIRRHYQLVGRKVDALSRQLDVEPRPSAATSAPELDPTQPTAVVLAGGYGGLGLHTLLHIPRTFPGQFLQVVFVSVGVIDAGVFKGKDELDALAAKLTADPERYAAFARSVFFAGKLVFQRERWYQRILHNETAAAVERRLQFAGLPMIVMPVRMFH